MTDLRLKSLTSGSCGNAMLALCDRQALLIDAGASPRFLKTVLQGQGVGLKDLIGVVVTHEHVDHVKALESLASTLDIPIYASAGTAFALRHREINFTHLTSERSIEIGPFDINSFPIPHDAREPIGLKIRVGGKTICYATDTGSITSEHYEASLDADLVILEANHDLEMLRQCRYPKVLKDRIAGPTGHLSNIDAARFVADRVKSGKPCTFWLAHLSEAANTPSTALRTVLAALGKKRPRLEVAHRQRPSALWLGESAGYQLQLFD